MANSSLLFPDYSLAHASISQGNECAYPHLTYSFSDAFQTIDTVNLTPAQTLDTEDLDSHEPSNISSDEGALKVFSNSNPTTCLCSELLKVFEIVQLGQNAAQAKDIRNHLGNAIQSRRGSLGGYREDFPFQKEALKSCEKWLSQDASRIKSQHAMLIIEILEKLLRSILSMAESSLYVERGSAPPSPISSGNSTTSTKKRIRSAQGTRDTAYSHQTEHLRLDDEERAHVLKSVFVFRASRLKGVMERMAAITASNQWRTQELMVKDLLRRINTRDDLQ